MSDKLSNLIVQVTLSLLVLFSVITWAVVVIKGLQVARARKQDQRLRDALATSSNGLPALDAVEKQDGPLARLALVGVRAWDDVSDAATAGNVAVPREVLELNLRRQIQKERHTTESGLAILASIGTTSPFVGLFGTVVGILHALTSISAAGSASLDVVAGPIGEALIATAIGIAVAVPAVLAFNYFVRRLKIQSGDLEDFAHGLVGGALRSTLFEPRSGTSGERPVIKVSEARNGALREART